MKRVRYSLMTWLVVAGVLMYALLPIVHVLAMSVPQGIATTLCSLSGSRTVYVDPGKPAAPQSPGLRWLCPLCVAGTPHALPPALPASLVAGGQWRPVQVATVVARAGRRNEAIHFSSRAPPVA